MASTHQPSCVCTLSFPESSGLWIPPSTLLITRFGFFSGFSANNLPKIFWWTEFCKFLTFANAGSLVCTRFTVASSAVSAKNKPVRFRTSRFASTTICHLFVRDSIRMSRLMGFQSASQGTGRYDANKRDYHDKESHAYKPTRRSIQLIAVVVLLFLIFTFIRNHHQSEIVPLEGNALDRGSVSSTGSKFAIVTFETRDVTYWKESLGNKFSYTRRHGYLPQTSLQCGLF